VWIRIEEAPIDVNALLESVRHPGHGAQVLFVGTVRDLNQGRSVIGIRYEAYREMAESVLHQIAGEAERTDSGLRIGAAHRIGDLEVGEASVAIAVSSVHRAQAFAAARYIIEEIKKRLPVWKHEKFSEGGAEWLEGVNPMTGAGTNE
jgi:molybdopterin synthase catalytic subunit